MAESELDRRVAAVRRFNRFYTRQIGLLGEGYLDSPFSLTEVRVLYELAHRTDPTARELAQALGLDAGYLSRILRRFEQRRLIARTRSTADGRQSLLALTRAGRAAIDPLQARSHADIGAMLGRLPAPRQRRLLEAMGTIEDLLGARSEARAPWVLRPHRPGDLGWIVHRHAVLYTREYGWDESFEGLVASVAAAFIAHHDPKRERCWIAEKDGEAVGSVLLVSKSRTVAQLRLLLVEPEARGLGIGARLVAECERFARQVGYRRITLWTNSILTAARQIYQAAGYRLVHREKHRSFGADLVGETWQLDL